MRRFGLIILGLIIILLVLAVALRSPRPVMRDDGVIVASIYRQVGQSEGDLVVTGQELFIDPEAHVIGNASLIGQRVEIGGQIDGDVIVLADETVILPDAVVGGSLHILGEAAQVDGKIDGDLQLHSSSADVAPTAEIGGVVRVCDPNLISGLSAERQRVEPCDELDVFAPLIALRNGVSLREQLPAPLDTMSLVIGGLLFVGVTGLMVTILPLRVSRVEEAIRQRPLSLLGVGAAVYMLAVGLSIAVIITLAGFPPLALVVVPLFAVVMFGAGIFTLFGLPTMALIIGDALIARMGQRQPPVIAAVFGAAVLYLGLTVVGLLPFGEGFVLLLGGAVGALGSGGAAATRFGGQPAQRAYFIQG